MFSYFFPKQKKVSKNCFLNFHKAFLSDQSVSTAACFGSMLRLWPSRTATSLETSLTHYESLVKNASQKAELFYFSCSGRGILGAGENEVFLPLLTG